MRHCHSSSLAGVSIIQQTVAGVSTPQSSLLANETSPPGHNATVLLVPPLRRGLVHALLTGVSINTTELTVRDESSPRAQHAHTHTCRCCYSVAGGSRRQQQPLKQTTHPLHRGDYSPWKPGAILRPRTRARQHTHTVFFPPAEHLHYHTSTLLSTCVAPSVERPPSGG